MKVKLSVIACLMLPAISFGKVPENKITYVSLYSDEKGVSHQAQCLLDKLSFQQFSVKGNPELVSTDDMHTTRYVYNIMPVGWSGTWHKSPTPQWVIPVEGQWYIESMDDHKVVYSPGELSFGYDVNAKLINGKVGHKSGSVGNAPAKVMVVQVNSLPKEISDKRCMAGGSFIRQV